MRSLHSVSNFSVLLAYGPFLTISAYYIVALAIGKREPHFLRGSQEPVITSIGVSFLVLIAFNSIFVILIEMTLFPTLLIILFFSPIFGYANYRAQEYFLRDPLIR